MRANDFLLNEEILDEIAMSPTSLRQQASQVGATAGMEFEMIVPDASTGNDDEVENDYDQDERVNSFDDIYEFFTGGEGINSNRSVRDAIESLRESFREWSYDIQNDEWDNEGRDIFNDYAYQYFDKDEAQEEAEEIVKGQDDYESLSSEEYDRRVQEIVDEKLQEWLDGEWEDQGRLYDRARENWENDWEWPDESQYFRDQGWRYMSQLESEMLDHDVYWPHHNSGGATDIESIADDFRHAIDRKVNYSGSYHGGKREPNAYVVEPDSSLEGERGDGGLEFISPPLPLDDMLSDLNKVIEWAKDKGCYTNKSTGLHMNVSIPNYSRDNLDYVKLALLLGDQYVLGQFGRSSNTYCKSALGKIKDSVRYHSENALKPIFDQMRSGLVKLASQSIHNGMTDKYISINTKAGYIEFRSPGGNWLDSDIPKLENTLLRFVVALDAACDPQKYRQEYLKKLYKLLNAKTKDDPITWFAQYVSGNVSKNVLKQAVRSIQSSRTLAKGSPNQKYWWKVDLANASIEVVATTEKEAKDKARKEWNLTTLVAPDNQLSAKPLRPYAEQQSEPIPGSTLDLQRQRAQQTPTGNQEYVVYTVDGNHNVGTFMARAGDRESARLGFNSFLTRIGRSSPAGFGYRAINT